MTVNPQDFALVIGINDYPNYRPLQGAVQDAQDFAAWLMDKRTGGGLLADNCLRIYSKARPLHPIQDDIDTALDKIRQKAKGTGARRFYFYFSGHGQSSENEDINLCLAKWSATDHSRIALSSRDCFNFIVSCIGFKEVVVLLDCCRVRVVGASGLPPGVNCVRPVDSAGQVRMFKAYATEFQDLAYEAAAAGAPAAVGTPAQDSTGPLIQGHFTRALLAGLRGGAASAGGGVRPSELKKYLEREVPRVAQAARHRQQARVPANDLDESSVFGSALPLTQQGNLTIRFSPTRQGDILLYGPTADVVRQGDANSGPWLLNLERGLYQLVEAMTQDEHAIRFQPREEMTYVDF